MRALAIVTALLLLLSPLATAGDGKDDDGSSGSSSSGSGSSGSGSESTTSSGDPGDGDGKSGQDPAEGDEAPDDDGDGCPAGPSGRPPQNESEVQKCRERYCRENPGDERCPQDGPKPADQGPREWRRWCKDEAREDAQRERCRRALAEYEGERDGRWISFRVDAANATLLDYRIGGLLAAESIHLETGSENLTVRVAGSAIRIGDGDTELVLHDDPTGLVRFKGDDGSVSLQLPANATVRAAHDGSAAQVFYAGGKVGHLRSDNATFLSQTVVASEFLALLVPQQRGQDKAQDGGERDDGRGEEHAADVRTAIEERRIGAEITLKPADAAAASAAQSGVQVLAYDDVDVQVRLPAAAVATPDAPIRIEVSAELDEGRTIVLNVDGALLESADPAGLVLRYFDLHEQADGSILETEVVFRQAAGLQDILDPTDDGGSPEYWVVEDANGLQLLASVPHWSAHAITLGSVAQAIASNPSVALGIAVGAAASVVAGVALFWPRRED